MKYTIQIGSTIYEFRHLKFSREASTESQPFEAMLTVAGVRLPAAGEAVTITKEIDNVKLVKYQGKVEQIRFLNTAKGTLLVSGFDLGRKIKYLPPATRGYSSAKASTSFVDLRNPSGTTDLTAGTTDTTDSVHDTIDFGKDDKSYLARKDAMDLLQIISNRDIYIERDGKANFLNGAGTDRTTTHIFQVGDPGNCILDDDIGYIEDYTRKVLKVDVKGAGVGKFGYLVGSAQDGAYTSAEKSRILHLPFLKSTATCNSAATNALAELNKRVQYAKVQITDLFTTNWDVFDKVRFKARLRNKTVDDSTMKVFRIETYVSPERQQLETVDVILHNFGRAVWAKLLDPIRAKEGVDDQLNLSTIATQVQEQIGTSGGASVVTNTHTNVAEITLGTIDTMIDSIAISGTVKTAGIHISIPIDIVPRKRTTTITNGLLSIYAKDTTSGISYPITILNYSSFRGDESFQLVHLFLPPDVAGHTIEIRGSVDLGEVDILIDPTYYSIGEHQH